MENTDFDEDDRSPHGCASEWASMKRLLAQPRTLHHVEETLLRAFERRHVRLPWYRRLQAQWRDAGTSLAGVGCVAALALACFVPLPLVPPAPAAALAMLAMNEGFLPLVDPRRLRMATHVQLLHAELPRHALLSLGVPADETIPDELVRTDLMVTDAGEPIAIRVAVN